MFRISAKITALAARSSSPEDPNAVDADVYVGSKFVGAVTLTTPEDPRATGLATWGSLENWACQLLQEWLEGFARDERQDLIDAIIASVEAQFSLLSDEAASELRGEA